MAGTLMGSNIMSATVIAAGNPFIDNTGTGDVLYGGIGQEQSYGYAEYGLSSDSSGKNKEPGKHISMWYQNFN